MENNPRQNNDELRSSCTTAQHMNSITSSSKGASSTTATSTPSSKRNLLLFQHPNPTVINAVFAPKKENEDHYEDGTRRSTNMKRSLSDLLLAATQNNGLRQVEQHHPQQRTSTNNPIDCRRKTMHESKVKNGSSSDFLIQMKQTQPLTKKATNTTTVHKRDENGPCANQSMSKYEYNTNHATNGTMKTTFHQNNRNDNERHDAVRIKNNQMEINSSSTIHTAKNSNAHHESCNSKDIIPISSSLVQSVNVAIPQCSKREFMHDECKNVISPSCEFPTIPIQFIERQRKEESSIHDHRQNHSTITNSDDNTTPSEKKEDTTIIGTTTKTTSTKSTITTTRPPSTVATPQCGCVSDHTTTTASTSMTETSSISLTMSLPIISKEDSVSTGKNILEGEECDEDLNNDNDITMKSQPEEKLCEATQSANDGLNHQNKQNQMVELVESPSPEENDFGLDYVQRENTDKRYTQINNITNHEIEGMNQKESSSIHQNQIKEDTTTRETSTSIQSAINNMSATLHKHSAASTESKSKEAVVQYKNNVDKLKKSHASIQKLKIGLYMEAMKVHAGSSAERKFSEYWDSFGKFISSSFQQQHGTSSFSSSSMMMMMMDGFGGRIRQKRSNDNIACNGIEAVLNNFLTTKSLRKKHNSLVKALMKQCMCAQVLESHVKQHIPNQWKKRIRKIENVEKKYHDGSKGQRLLDVRDIVEYHHPTSYDEQEDSSPKLSSQIKSLHDIEKRNVSKAEDDRHEEHCGSSRIPGPLEIDHMAREYLDQTNTIFTSSGLQFASAAVREFISQIVKNALVSAKNREMSCTTSTSGSCGGGGEATHRKRKIKSFDVINSLHFSFNGASTRSSSRMIWERGISEINVDNCLQRNSEMEGIQEEITRLITSRQQTKRQKVEVIDNSSQSKSSPVRCSSRASSVGKGKNLAQMVLRRHMDELSKKGSTTDDDDESKQNMSIAERISRPPSTIGIEKSVRSNISPTPPATTNDTMTIISGKPRSFVERQQYLIKKN